MPTYRFAPDWVYPSQIEDVRSAMAFVAAHGSQWGFEPGRMVTMGSSAGGYLALILATIGPEDQLGRREDQQDRDTRPVAAIGYCPVLRMYGTVAPQTEAENPELYRQADIAQRFSGAEPPILLLHGTADETIPIDESRRAASRLTELGGSAELIELPGVKHGFGYGTKTPAQQEALKHVEAFLAKLSLV